MNDADRTLLEDHLDGRLDALDEARVTMLLERDDAARRFVHEHETVWDGLGEAFGELDETREGFAEATVARAFREHPRRRIPLGLAAALLLSLGFAAWWQSGQSAQPNLLAPADEEVVRHLHVLRDMDLIDTHAEALDLRLRWDVWRAFEGEQEGEG
jgi:anti-sigma factor RsiW